jgi:prepilin-type N-terminal cleavage/methylation domain-containing protein
MKGIGCHLQSSHTHGFTLFELLIVIAITALLGSFLVSMLNGARERGKRAACKSNMRQAYLATVAYADDHDGKLPRTSFTENTDGSAMIKHAGHIEKWGALYPDYLSTLDVLYCPSRKRTAFYSIAEKKDFNTGDSFVGCSYSHRTGFNTPLYLYECKAPVDTLLAIDVFWSEGRGPCGATIAHGDGYHNTLYFDGHNSQFVDKTGFLEQIHTGGGNGPLIMSEGYSHVEAND